MSSSDYIKKGKYSSLILLFWKILHRFESTLGFYFKMVPVLAATRNLHVVSLPQMIWQFQIYITSLYFQKSMPAYSSAWFGKFWRFLIFYKLLLKPAKSARRQHQEMLVNKMKNKIMFEKTKNSIAGEVLLY